MKKKAELILPRDTAIKLIQDNHSLFKNKPIFEISETGDDLLRFKGITRHINWVIGRSGSIAVCADYRNECYDIVQEFDLVPERTRAMRFRCGLCRKCPGEAVSVPIPEYESIEQLWMDHCLKPLTEWTHENFVDDALLCLCRSRGATAAFVCSSENQKERIMGRRDFFKALPVVLKQGRTSKADLQRQ